MTRPNTLTCSSDNITPYEHPVLSRSAGGNNQPPHTLTAVAQDDDPEERERAEILASAEELIVLLRFVKDDASLDRFYADSPAFSEEDEDLSFIFGRTAYDNQEGCHE